MKLLVQYGKGWWGGRLGWATLGRFVTRDNLSRLHIHQSFPEWTELNASYTNTKPITCNNVHLYLCFQWVIYINVSLFVLVFKVKMYQKVNHRLVANKLHKPIEVKTEVGYKCTFLLNTAYWSMSQPGQGWIFHMKVRCSSPLYI